MNIQYLYSKRGHRSKENAASEKFRTKAFNIDDAVILANYCRTTISLNFLIGQLINFLLGNFLIRHNRRGVRKRGSDCLLSCYTSWTANKRESIDVRSGFKLIILGNELE